MRNLRASSVWQRLCVLAIGLSCMGVAAGAFAGDGHHDRRGGKAGHYQKWHEPHRPHESHRHADRRHHHHPVAKHGHAHGWHYHRGRYWAPAAYRGRYCNDFRHYRGVHYHVSTRDYYDYYYPRFRHYGPLHGAASVIITVPLW